jgi:phosphatidate cytidylyltransferase
MQVSVPKPSAPDTVWYALGAAFLVLALASIVIYAMRKKHPSRDFSEARFKIKTWWQFYVFLVMGVGFAPAVSVVVCAFISFLAFKEYLSMVPTRRSDHRVLFWAYMAIPIQYVIVGMAWYCVFVVFIPVYWFLFLPMRMVLIGETKGFLRAVGSLQWGLMITVFGLSHMAYLLMLPDAGNPKGGGDALLFFLIFMTLFNDGAQYAFGVLIGKRPALPTVNPNKTLEGLVVGGVATVFVAVSLAQLLTPFTLLQSLAVGLLITIGGFVGSVTMSAIKRDLGVRDSELLLPGHGGVLGRLDSLTFTAPLFFHFTYYLHY